jgi:hypothetical protein
MRISRVAQNLVILDLVMPALLMLGGCHRTATIDVPEADRIECAVGGKGFERSCAIERSAGPAVLTLRNADGGFHRLSIAPDNTISAADGADLATGHALADGRLEVGIGSDRYRLPARK